MTDYDLHRPDYSGTTTEDWDAPRLEDFDTDDLSAVDDHFVLSSSGFPPEAFTDLNVPVVDPDGNLNENALRTAHAGAHGVEEMDDVDDDTVERVQELLDGLSREAFDHALGD